MEKINLTEREIYEIHYLWRKKLSNSSNLKIENLSNKYGLSIGMILDILAGRKYPDIKEIFDKKYKKPKKLQNNLVDVNFLENINSEFKDYMLNLSDENLNLCFSCIKSINKNGNDTYCNPIAREIIKNINLQWKNQL